MPPGLFCSSGCAATQAQVQTTSAKADRLLAVKYAEWRPPGGLIAAREGSAFLVKRLAEPCGNAISDVMSEPFSVIVPVYNEGRRLFATVPPLLEGLPAGCEIIYICNGCQDDSEAILRELVGGAAIMLATPVAGKALAIRAGEEQTNLFPRFYVDSDVVISGGALARLAAGLGSGIELVSPRIEHEFGGTAFCARVIHRYRQSLPHAREGAYHHVLGISARGRARWGEFPDLWADDSFIEAMIPDDRKRLIKEVTVRTRPPQGLWQWIMVRKRWHIGHRQLRALGYSPPHVPGQCRALLLSLMSPTRALPAVLYVCTVALAMVLAKWRGKGSVDWYQDQSSR